MCNQGRLRPACAYAQSDQSICLSLEYSMSVKLLTEHHFEFLSIKGGCTGLWESYTCQHATLLEISYISGLIFRHDCSKAVLLLWIFYVFFSVLCLLCLCVRLFICALWSPAGKGLTSWLSFVVSTVSLSLSHRYPGSVVVLDCIDS